VGCDQRRHFSRVPPRASGLPFARSILEITARKLRHHERDLMSA